MTRHCQVQPVRRTQRGTALAIALIFLLLMTLLGVSAMQGSNMQERMAGNLRDRNMAFQSAEAALRAGETWLLTLGNQILADGNDPVTDPVTGTPNPAEWDGTAPLPTATVPGLDAQLSSDPEFYVGPPSLRRVGIQLPPDFRRIYPVTARGAGGSDGASVVLQSTFEPPQ